MRVAMNDVEDAVLSAFLFASAMNDMDDLFKLNIDYFSTPIRKKIAKEINSAIEDNTLGMLDTLLESKVVGTQWHIVYIGILAQTPIPISLAKKYHDTVLFRECNNRLIKGIM